MLNKIRYQTEDQQDNQRSKKEKILNEFKNDVIEEFTHQINLEDLDAQRHDNLPNKEVFENNIKINLVFLYL